MSFQRVNRKHAGSYTFGPSGYKNINLSPRLLSRKNKTVIDIKTHTYNI